MYRTWLPFYPDYHDHLVPQSARYQHHSDSEYDTDDLIEDARNFVIAAGDSSKLVDKSDWANIDEKRRQKRLSRGERKRQCGMRCSGLGSDGDQAEDEPDTVIKSTGPFLPR